MPDDGRPAAAGTQPGLGEIAAALLAHAVPPLPGEAEGVELRWLARAATRLPRADAARPALTLALADPHPLERPLARAANALALDPAEIAAAALALAVETDALAGRAVAWAQAPAGGARPSLGLLATALRPLDPRPHLPARLASGVAVRSGLLRLLGTGPLPERTIGLAEGMVAALTGADPLWPGLELVTAAPDPDWPPSLAAALARYLDGIAGGGASLLTIRGAAGPDRAEIAARAGLRLGARPALIALDHVEPAGLGPFCAAAGLLPVFAASVGPGEYRPLPDLPGCALPVIAFLGPEGHVGRSGHRAVDWTLPLPSAEERVRLWSAGLRDASLATALGSEHLLGAGRIRRLTEAARAEAGVAGRSEPDRAAVAAALWVAEGEGLGALAHPVRESIPDAALVTGSALGRELELLLARCRRREVLADGLGAAVVARHKAGVRSLFTGPSGTGKTMAAAWLAGRLTLPLYRVDLAAVSSKYIGETEKNLARLLAAAEEQEVMLLFDEADSLFGKRTDIADSNDRFANAQTNYLLQRIESYTGIVILTSNSRSRFDEAFMRRLDVIVEFTQPGPQERRALWAAHLGSGHAVADADLNRLAAMAQMAGGHIRNVVLTAAVLAREAGRPITYPDIAGALGIEYRKLGWTVPAELLRSINGA